MRNALLLAATLMLSVPLVAQERYLVAPSAEVIPLTPRENAAEVLKARVSSVRSSAGVCPDRFTFGYDPSSYTVNSNFGSYHRDVLGEWFVAPASGTIDSIFWFNRAQIGAYDSTIYLRVHRSNIGPSYGPGIRPGPFDPPCQNWGYWNNANDSDQHVAAFLEDATDTAWVSTINGTPYASAPPFGKELWGLGGYPVRIRPNSIGSAAMSDLGTPLAVTAGDKFFISLRVGQKRDSLGGHKAPGTAEERTEWNASGFSVGTNDPDYPSRDWKFYEHAKGPSNCAGVPIDSIKNGWVARGGFGADSLTVAAYNIWYVMSVVSNTPPIISPGPSHAHVFLDLGTWPVSAEISDCNVSDPANAGVASAALQYAVDGAAQPDIEMVLAGGESWSGMIPQQPPGAVVRYRVRAVDKDGAAAYSRSDSIRVVTLSNAWYDVDTSGICAPLSIRSTGTRIARNSYFGPPQVSPGYNPMDEGTAGPFDMGGEFSVFGDTFRYVWVGVNGAIALTKDATDTIDVNANGYYSPSWDVPYRTYSGRSNPALALPRMFIAPFWNDFILADSFQSSPGVISYGPGADGCSFIVEWDSISNAATFPAHGVHVSSDFRVVLNRCDGAIAFQYDNIEGGIDSSALVGMQLDTSSVQKPYPFVFVNRLGYPYETKPRNSWCVKMTPAAPLGVSRAVSLPDAFTLAQNYPNPFNPSTVISFTLPKASDVRLEIFNVVGQRLAVLVNDRKGPGSYEATWDAPQASSGLYFYRLEAREAGASGRTASFMKKMVLMR